MTTLHTRFFRAACLAILGSSCLSQAQSFTVVENSVAGGGMVLTGNFSANWEWPAGFDTPFHVSFDNQPSDAYTVLVDMIGDPTVGGAQFTRSITVAISRAGSSKTDSLQFVDTWGFVDSMWQPTMAVVPHDGRLENLGDHYSYTPQGQGGRLEMSFIQNTTPGPSVPEPGSIGLVASLALGGFAFFRRRMS